MLGTGIMYKCFLRIFQFFASFSFNIKATLMLPKEPGPAMELYERICLRKYYAEGGGGGGGIRSHVALHEMEKGIIRWKQLHSIGRFVEDWVVWVVV